MFKKNNLNDQLYYYYDLGWSDREIAEQIGITKARVSYWRKKNNIPANSYKIIVDLKQLFGEEDNRKLNTFMQILINTYKKSKMRGQKLDVSQFINAYRELGLWGLELLEDYKKYVIQSENSTWLAKIDERVISWMIE